MVVRWGQSMGVRMQRGYVLVILAGVMGMGSAWPGEADAWTSFRRTPDLCGVAVTRLPGTLEKQWSFEVGAPVYSTAAITEGRVVFGTDDGRLMALNLTDGKRLWTYQAGAPVSSSPLVIDGTVFVGDEKGVFHAVKVVDGEGLWKYAGAKEQILGSPAPGPDTVVFGSYDHDLYCLERKTGALRWKFTTEMQVHGTPCMVEDMVVIAGCDGQVRGIGLADGVQRLACKMEGNLAAGPAYRDGVVYFGSLASEYLALRLKDSKVIWTQKDKDGQFFSTAALNDSAAIFSSRSGRVFCVNPLDGTRQWTFTTQASVDSSPVIAGAYVYVGSDDGNLYALDLKTGKEVWRFSAGGSIRASPAVACDRLVIGTEDGAVYCFRGAQQEHR